jgi:hypothetical protein
MKRRRVRKDSPTAVKSKNPSDFSPASSLMRFGKSKNADGSEGFIKTPTRKREAEPTFDFLLLTHL